MNSQELTSIQLYTDILCRDEHIGVICPYLQCNLLYIQYEFSKATKKNQLQVGGR